MFWSRDWFDMVEVGTAGIHLCEAHYPRRVYEHVWS